MDCVSPYTKPFKIVITTQKSVLGKWESNPSWCQMVDSFPQGSRDNIRIQASELQGTIIPNSTMTLKKLITRNAVFSVNVLDDRGETLETPFYKLETIKAMHFKLNYLCFS